MRENVNVVLAHGAWADGSNWAKVIGPLAAEGIRVFAAPLPLTSFAEDMAAVERTLEHALWTTDERVKSDGEWFVELEQTQWSFFEEMGQWLTQKSTRSWF